MTTPNLRIEKDTFGPIEVPADRLWGAQTQRSLQNFKISGEHMPTLLLYALALVKKAVALVNLDLGQLDASKARAIATAKFLRANTIASFRWSSGKPVAARKPT